MLLINKPNNEKIVKKKFFEEKSKNMILKFKRALLKEQPKPAKSPNKISSSKLLAYYINPQNNNQDGSNRIIDQRTQITLNVKWTSLHRFIIQINKE